MLQLMFVRMGSVRSKSLTHVCRMGSIQDGSNTRVYSGGICTKWLFHTRMLGYNLYKMALTHTRMLGYDLYDNNSCVHF